MRTHRPLAPIERMIDQATSHHRDSIMMRIMVRTRCPGCKKIAAIPAEEDYPDDTALIEVECAVCNPVLDDRLLRFLSATGDLLAGDALIPEQSNNQRKNQMGRQTKSDPRLARLRRETALDRAELRGPSTPRQAPAGVTSFPIKMRDPETARMVEAFLAERRST